jgi:hypothetical protein
MDEKASDLDHNLDGAYLPQMGSPNNARHQGRSAYVKGVMLRRLCYAICIALTAWLMLHSLGRSDWRCRMPALRPHLPNAGTILAEKNDTKVALEAHIMSKCPDAKACLQKLVVPAMVEIADKVDFRLSYIGRSVNPPCA